MPHYRSIQTKIHLALDRVPTSNSTPDQAPRLPDLSATEASVPPSAATAAHLSTYSSTAAVTPSSSKAKTRLPPRVRNGKKNGPKLDKDHNGGSVILPEEPFLLSNQHLAMQFLGPLQDMPFYMVRVNPSSAISADPLSSNLSPLPDSSSIPLAIHVSLSPSSFLSCKSLKEEKAHLSKADRQDLHISVFYNGEFAGARLVHAQAGTSGHTGLLQVFDGRRVSRASQRPFCYLPSAPVGQDSMARAGNRKKPPSAPEPRARWADIGISLQTESKHWQSEEAGITMPTSEVLDALSQLPLPVQAEFPEALGRMFGIIDVIIALGSGRKLSSAYPSLWEPRRYVDPRFNISVPNGVEGDQKFNGSQKAGFDDGPPSEPLRDVQMVTRSALRKIHPSSAPPAALGTISGPAQPATPTPAPRQHPAKPPIKLSVSSSRGGAKLGLSISPHTINKRKSSISRVSRTAGSPLSKPELTLLVNAPETPALSKVARPSMNKSGALTTSGRIRRTRQPSKLSEMTLPVVSSTMPIVPKAREAPVTPIIFDPTVPASEQSKQLVTKLSVGAAPIVLPWTPSPLNDDSVLTYAGWEGNGQKEWSTDTLKKTTSERLGHFTETAVLMVVRFIVT
ncbi:MAG: hypothetical protein M1814_005037 [Vezdaea aestivalis]|nr:MAG: hypothetical protein M1814_005037 [Vezdaea aestivalis]